MSLINDALKRASQTEKNRPRDPGPPSVMQPAPEPRRSAFPVWAGACIVILLAAAAALVWHYCLQSGNPRPVAAKEAAPVVAAPPLHVEPVPEPAPLPPPVAAPPSIPSAPPAVVAIAVTPPPAPPPFPELKLQSIFYSRDNPKAAINGQIHGQNELIGDVRILTITQDKVTVEWNGQTKDLILQAQ